MLDMQLQCFTVAVILHMFLVTILIMLVSETVLLVTGFKCVYRTFSLFHFLLILCYFFVTLIANKGIGI